MCGGGPLPAKAAFVEPVKKKVAKKSALPANGRATSSNSGRSGGGPGPSGGILSSGGTGDPFLNLNQRSLIG